MSFKDYYSILQVPPHATQAQIKQAYRKLALQYHPDKNAQDPYAAAVFNDVKEAYEILTDPARRDAYLQERWYLFSTGKKADTQEPATPPGILIQILGLEKHVATLDTFRLNQEALQQDILRLLNPENLTTLATFDDSIINQQIAHTALKAARPLSGERTATILERLEKLLEKDPATLQHIRKAINRKQQQHLLARYNWLFILFLALLLCAFIYFAAT